MIRLKSPREIDIIRRGGRIVAEALQLVENLTRPGRTTGDLDREVEALILKRGGRPAFKGYRGFPNCCCISINEQLVHGIPGRRVIREGDIVSVDIGVEIEKYFSDAAITVPVGKISDETQKLLRVARKSLEKAIAILRAGVRLSEIGRTIQEYVESHGFSVVRQLVGHGIGRELWEEPQVPNFWDGGESTPPDRALEKGTVIAIEPMVNVGGCAVRTLSDNWTVVTSDGSLCAHFEHTVAITETGYEVLTTL
jgi:methionyl aminopeptidase